MKKYVLFFLFVLCTVVMMAENYPHRSDYLWVTVPDHTDWLYECGDEANIEVQFYKYGIPREGKVEWVHISKGHTAIPVPIFSYGPHAQDFMGVQGNEQVSQKILKLLQGRQ